MRTVPTRELSTAALLAAVIAGSAGCTATGVVLGAAVVAGAATVVYVEGDLETELDGSPTEVAAATEKAFEDLDLVLVESESSQLDGRVEAETAEDRSVVVKLKSIDGGRTKASIRVGTIGDEDLSRQVLDKIEQHLVG